MPPLALTPLPKDAILGGLDAGDVDRVAGEAARTAPGRENGGNQDIKNLTKGSRIFYPVFVPGGNLSVGDLHFSQGDGEITFCGAIEMGGFIDVRLDVLKGGMETYGVAFSGVSVTLADEQKYLDSQLAYQRACLHAIDYLVKFGYSPEQAYLLLGAAPIEGRFSGVVDIPNSCATVYLPTSIFAFDIRPGPGGLHQVNPGMGAPHSAF